LVKNNIHVHEDLSVFYCGWCRQFLSFNVTIHRSLRCTAETPSMAYIGLCVYSWYQFNCPR